jgi:FMN phosphatase YigB (HAD superfamily)
MIKLFKQSCINIGTLDSLWEVFQDIKKQYYEILTPGRRVDKSERLYGLSVKVYSLYYRDASIKVPYDAIEWLDQQAVGIFYSYLSQYTLHPAAKQALQAVKDKGLDYIVFSDGSTSEISIKMMSISKDLPLKPINVYATDFYKGDIVDVVALGISKSRKGYDALRQRHESLVAMVGDNQELDIDAARESGLQAFNVGENFDFSELLKFVNSL